MSDERDAALAACARQDGAELAYPFGPQAAVYKVAGKIFAFLGLERIAARRSRSSAIPSTARRCAPSTPRSPPATT